VPSLTARAARAVGQAVSPGVSADDVSRRLAAVRDVVANVDLFVAPSPFIAAEFERFGIPPSRVRVSDLGFPPLVARPRGGVSQPVRLGYVGTLAWHKGVHVLIDAVRRLPSSSYELHLYGDLDVFPDYTASLRAGADGLPVRFMGGFDRARAADIYAELDLLVVPSLWLENSPLVVREAFMAGVPVVAARIGGIPHLVEEGRSGWLYEPESAADLAAVLTGLIDEPARIDACRRTLPGVKTLAEDAREWEAIYTERAAPA
jgi:glycosyltransferase involved in cell wall biosynthesis